MNLQEYLLTHNDAPYINIVGPFYNGVYLEQEPVVFVDGGAEAREGHIGFAVGDGDSTNKVLDEYLPTEKNESDLAYTLKQIPTSCEVINLLGFLGGRRDHELINLLEAYHFIENSIKQDSTKKRLYFDYEVVIYSSGNWSFNVDGLFSLVSFTENQIELKGQCKYTLTAQQTFRSSSSHGLSNEGFGSIELSCTKPVIVFLNSNKS